MYLNFYDLEYIVGYFAPKDDSIIMFKLFMSLKL